MDLRLVEYFVAVVDHGGITKAAHALYVAQPSLSQAIRALEGQLGVRLFDRSGRRLVLTAEGETFYVPARRILQDVRHARERVDTVRSLGAGRLDIAALSTLSVDPLPRLVSGFRERHPQIVVNVVDPGGSAGVESLVRQGTVEIGLTELPVRNEKLLTQELLRQEIAVVLPPALAAGLPDPVPLASVADIPLVMELSRGAAHPLLDDALAGAVGQVAVECAHRQVVWQLVMEGAGATFLPRSIAESELDGVVVRSTQPRLERSVGFVLRPGASSPAAVAFLAGAGVSSPAPGARAR